jgi:hypothetical protein
VPLDKASSQDSLLPSEWASSVRRGVGSPLDDADVRFELPADSLTISKRGGQAAADIQAAGDGPGNPAMLEMRRAAVNRGALGREHSVARLHGSKEVPPGGSLAYLKSQGIQIPANVTPGALKDLQAYLLDFTRSGDRANAVNGIRQGLAAGQRDAKQLLVAAEQSAYVHLGVPDAAFQLLARRGLTANDLQELRGYASKYAPSQSGNYLVRVAEQPGLSSFTELRAAMTRDMAKDLGFVLPTTPLDNSTLLTLVDDVGDVNPDLRRTMIAGFNKGIARGETAYTALNAEGNREALRELGADDSLLAAMDPGEAALQSEKDSVSYVRAKQLRLLRDRLRVLPPAQRAEAIETLRAGPASLLNFDRVLAPKLDAQLAALTGSSKEFVAHLTANMTAQQRANFVTALARLPLATRTATFTGLTGTLAAREAEAINRLAASTEQMGVKVWRSPGRAPLADEMNPRAVKDWSLQSLVELHNALTAMAKDGQVPKNLRDTLYVHMIKLESAARPSAHQHHLGLLLKSPGEESYKGGTDGVQVGRDGKDYIQLFEMSTMWSNANVAAGMSTGEGTAIHESGHGIQLGGRPGDTKAEKVRRERLLMREWSGLSGWRNADGSAASGYKRVGHAFEPIYKTSDVRVAERGAVITNYAASDPSEDYAEYTRFFYTQPVEALRTSPEKFLYLNRAGDEHYSADQIRQFANETGLREGDLLAATQRLDETVAKAPFAALQPEQLVQIT